MKAWEEEYAKRITAKIVGWGNNYPYENGLLDSITSLRLYHDLIYEYEIANAIGNIVIPTSDYVVKVL